MLEIWKGGGGKKKKSIKTLNKKKNPKPDECNSEAQSPARYLHTSHSLPLP